MIKTRGSYELIDMVHDKKKHGDLVSEINFPTISGEKIAEIRPKKQEFRIF